MIEKINGGLGKIIMFLSSVMFGLMVLVAIWQVISRYVLNAPSTFSEGFSSLLAYLGHDDWRCLCLPSQKTYCD